MSNTSKKMTFSKKGDLKQDVTLDLDDLKKAVLIIRAVNHKLRQQIVRQLEESGKLTVSEIYMKLRLEQSVASQHLAILRRAGIVKTERHGKFIFYYLNRSRLHDVSKLVDELATGK